MYNVSHTVFLSKICHSCIQSLDKKYSEISVKWYYIYMVYTPVAGWGGGGFGGFVRTPL